MDPNRYGRKSLTFVGNRPLAIDRGPPHIGDLHDRRFSNVLPFGSLI